MSQSAPATQEEAPPQLEAAPEPDGRGAQRPQAGLPAVDAVDRLPHRSTDRVGPWVMGVHGGAGESTVAAWLGWAAAEHAWPVPTQGPRPQVLLVARTNARGLRAARLAATEWARGDAPADLVGLVLMADAPGRLPEELRAQIRQLSGAVPATWAVRFLPELRTEDTPDHTTPAGAKRALRSIQKIAEKENT